MAAALIFETRPGAFGRTERATRFVGRVRACACSSGNWRPLADALRSKREAVWILRAGAWPLFDASHALPAGGKSDGRLPLCAFGATHFPGASGTSPLRAQFPTRAHAVLRRAFKEEFQALADEAADWHQLQARTGGDLCAGAPFDGELPSVASVWVEPPLFEPLAERLSAGQSFDAALREVLRRVPLRAVRLAQLDVCDDPAIRIAQVVTSLQRGGAERVTVDLVNALPGCGVRPFLFPLGAPTRGSFEPPDDAVEFAPGRNRAERLARCAEKAIALGCDAVHAHLLSAADMEVFAQCGIPIVATVHNVRPGWPADFERLRGVTLLAACACAVEDDLKTACVTVPVRTVWNGIDAAQYGGPADPAWRARLEFANDDLVLLALANPRPQKRLELLPAVLHEVQRLLAAQGAGRCARLVIAGEAAGGSAAAQACVQAVRNACERLQLNNDVRLIGAVENVASLLSAVDVLVSASAWEGLSLAYLEALAAGRPVVATDAGGTRELAREHAALTVLPVEATSREFAAAILRALEAPRGALSPSFHAHAMAARYATLYPRAIQRTRLPQPRAGLFLVANNFSIGGAQSSARRLLLGLHARGVPVSAAVLQERGDDPTPGLCALRQAGIGVLIPPPRSGDPLDAVREILSEIDRRAPRAVLFWNAIAEHKVLLADGLLDTPVFDVSPGEMCFDALERYFARPRPGLPYTSAAHYGARLSGVIVKYRGEAERAACLLGASTWVVPNGLPLHEWKARSNWDATGRLVIGTSARLSPQKKLAELLAALRLAAPRMPPHVLRIAGNVERGAERYAEELKALADGLNVEFVGEFARSQEFLNEVDLFAMISEPAGCPNASLEALAAGVPVVATAHGGASEQIIDGVTGRLVERGDAAALARALVELAHDTPQRARLGAAGRQHAETDFSLERMMDAYVRVCGL